MNFTDLPNADTEYLRKLLLKSVLSDGDVSRAAFSEWEKQIVFDDLDFESFKLLSAVYQKLLKDNLTSRLSLRIKGAHRRTWTENQLLLTYLKDLFATLKAAQIDFLIGDETIRLTEIRRDLGIYSLQNFSLIAPINHKKEFIQKVIEDHWQIETDELEKAVFKKDKVFHINVLWVSDKEFAFQLKMAETIPVKDSLQLILCAEEQILNLCTKEFLFSNDKKSRWQLIVSELFNAQKINSDKLISLAEKYYLINQLSQMLQKLADDFDIKIPDELINKLRGKFRDERIFSIRRKIYNLSKSYQIYKNQTKSNLNLLNFLAERWKTDSNKILLKRAFQSSMSFFQTK